MSPAKSAPKKAKLWYIYIQGWRDIDKKIIADTLIEAVHDAVIHHGVKATDIVKVEIGMEIDVA